MVRPTCRWDLPNHHRLKEVPIVRLVARLLLLLVALSGNGCSLALLKKPRLASGPAARDCTTSLVAPVLDAAASGLMVAGIVRVFTYEPTGFTIEVLSDEEAAAILALPAVLWGYSAARGFGWTSECRGRQSLSEEAIADYLRTLTAPSAVGPDGSAEEFGPKTRHTIPHPGETER